MSVPFKDLFNFNFRKKVTFYLDVSNLSNVKHEVVLINEQIKHLINIEVVDKIDHI